VFFYLFVNFFVNSDLCFNINVLIEQYTLKFIGLSAKYIVDLIPVQKSVDRSVD